MAAKIEGLLASALRKLGSEPGQLIDLVVTPATDAKAVDDLVRFVRERGGEPVRVDPDAVQVRLPVGEVAGLAASGFAAAVRMARLARMH